MCKDTIIWIDRKVYYSNVCLAYSRHIYFLQMLLDLYFYIFYLIVTTMRSKMNRCLPFQFQGNSMNLLFWMRSPSRKYERFFSVFEYHYLVFLALTLRPHSLQYFLSFSPPKLSKEFFKLLGDSDKITRSSAKEREN